MRDGQKNLLYKKSYAYDRFGNPILETFTGEPTGRRKPRDCYNQENIF